MLTKLFLILDSLPFFGSLLYSFSMLRIKFSRIGRKRQPNYRLVVAERKSKLNGQPVEDIGWYNPKDDSNLVQKDRLAHWMQKGALPTDTVHNFLVRVGIIAGPKRSVHSVKKASAEAKA